MHIQIIRVVEAVFRAYSRALSDLDKANAQELVRDEKALKGSFDHRKGNTLLQLVSAFCTNNQLILGHVEIPDKTNEIPVAQARFKDLKLPEGSGMQNNSSAGWRLLPNRSIWRRRLF